MDDKMLDKRLELLNKTYKKLPEQTDSFSIIQVIKEENNSKKKKRPIFHWPYVASFIGVLLITSVLTLQFTIGGDNRSGETKETEQQSIEQELFNGIKEAESLYELRTTQAAGRLGFTEETFNKTVMAQEAKRELIYIKSLPKRDGSLEKRLEILTNAKARLAETLQTPDMMMLNFEKNMKEEEVSIWIETFVKKQGSILPLAEEELLKYKGQWEKHVKDGKLNIYEFGSGDDVYSREMRRLVEGLTSNAVRLSYSEKEDKIITSFDFEFFHMMIEGKLPEGYSLFVNAQFSPVIHAGEIATSWKDAAKRLIEYDTMLQTFDDSSKFRSEVKIEYDRLYQFFVIGTVSQSIFDESNILKNDVKEAYEHLINTYPEFETTKSIKEVYAELNANNFQKPSRWIQPTPVVLQNEWKEKLSQAE
jgi:hypothetical protein